MPQINTHNYTFSLVGAVPTSSVVKPSANPPPAHQPFSSLRLITPPRLRLIPGLLPSEEADWTFSKLLAELPWSQKTNLQTGYINSHDSHASKCYNMQPFI
uniref:AlkB homolog 3, alpha-ketoglutarate dependent dioxygenase n=1 Tax=Oncorhynchus tshawytscha TaxID=74940 RepID=A0A8C8FZV9_ONCTS